MKKLCFLVTLLIFFSTVRAQDVSYPGDPFTSETKPPLRAKKLAGEFGSALFGGLLAGVVGFTAGMVIDGKRETILTAMHITYPFGAAAGAWTVGNKGDEQSSFLSTLGFSVLFSGLTYLAYPIIPEQSRGWVYLLSVPLGAVIGHNISRSYKQPIYNGLINRHNGRIALGLPAVQFFRSSGNRISLQWHILNLNF